MSVTLGIAIGAREIRAVLARSNVVSWQASVACSDVASVGTALRDILTQASAVAPRARVAVTLCPAWVQVKQLHGLPSVKPPRLASQLLRENQQSFFLWSGTPRLVADVHVAKDGTPWGAAYDADIVAAVVAALREKRKSIVSIAPALVVLVAATPGGLAWSDGRDAFELEGDAAGLRRAERVAAGDDIAAEECGGDAVRFRDAYAAAMVGRRRLSLVHRIQASSERQHARARTHRVIAVALAASAAIFAALAPGIRAARVERSLQAELETHRQAEIEIARDQAELKRITQTLDRVEAFRAERGQMTRILGAVSQAIPESTAILSLHVDSLEGGFTAVSPHISDVLPELADGELIVAPRIVGSLTRETVGGVQLERAAFRFGRPRAARTSTSRR